MIRTCVRQLVEQNTNTDEKDLHGLVALSAATLSLFAFVNIAIV